MFSFFLDNDLRYLCAKDQLHKTFFNLCGHILQHYNGQTPKCDCIASAELKFILWYSCIYHLAFYHNVMCEYLQCDLLACEGLDSFL